MLPIKNVTFNTHQGPYLQVNEDAIDFDLKHHLFILVDGIGGSHIGDKFAHNIKSIVKNSYTTFSGDADATLPFFYAQRYTIEGNALVNAVYQAHFAIKTENKQKKNYHEMGGGSLVSMCQSDHTVTLVGTGNCVAYLYRRGKLKILIEPDILEKLSREENPEQLATTPMSALGFFEEINLTICEHRVLRDDIIILMSDGAYGRIKLDELVSIIEIDDKSYEERIDDIFNLSNERGNLDNQSCLILHY